ncbi:dGTP triphosphohydrolase [Flavobacterium zepuense]|uniref:dGTP triphosphohydrolase n=1 Tax=Flavobacterium zepuense TaxID=2593302 RepID=UPI001C8F8B70|nr:dNTP triphosphohydrolase [Flavobacterium zepuense]
MKGKGGYEGNAQTFRVLNVLERRIPNESGLFLSKRTLLSVVKYFNKGEDHKKFLYDSDYEVVNKISLENEVTVRTLDAQIMDIADEIAYAAHDLEDALRGNLFTIDDLFFEFANSPEFKSAVSILQQIIDDSKKIASECKSNSSEDFHYFFTRQLTSNIVNTLVQDIGLIEVTEKETKITGTSNKKEIGYYQHGALANGLKKLTFKCLMRKPEILLYEKQGEKIINGLFEVFSDKNYNKELSLLPAEYRNLIDRDSDCRIICDYISGMMDSYAIQRYKKFFGENSLDKYYR